jgi:polyisoprenoid-binding protein YceI
MKQYRLITAGAAFLLTLAASAPAQAAAQDVAGTWVLSVQLDAGGGDATFVFEVDGTQIAGSYAGALGERDVTGTVEGSTVKFGFEDDQVGEVSFEGTIEGTSMSGRCNYGLLGEGTFSGNKSTL